MHRGWLLSHSLPTCGASVLQWMNELKKFIKRGRKRQQRSVCTFTFQARPDPLIIWKLLSFHVSLTTRELHYIAVDFSAFPIQFPFVFNVELFSVRGLKDTHFETENWSLDHCVASLFFLFEAFKKIRLKARRLEHLTSWEGISRDSWVYWVVFDPYVVNMYITRMCQAKLPSEFL